MATAEVIEYTETQQVDAQGELQPAIIPRFTVGGLSGSFTTDAILQEDFARDVVQQRVREKASNLLSEDAEVDVQLPSGE